VATPEDRLEVTLPEVRALAGQMARDLDSLATEMYDFIAARVPEARLDDEVAGLTLASCKSNIEAVLSMIHHGISARATEAPVAALEHARQMAARGVGIDATLRFYRLGLAYLFERWNTALVDAVPDHDRLMLSLRETSAFVFTYIDTVSSRVSAELLAERERRQRRAAVVRADVVRAILAGEPVDQAAAERSLGHPLAAPQLAFVCWTQHDPAALERSATAVAQAMGTGRPLLLADGPQALAGWVVPPGGREPDRPAVSRAVAAVAPEVHVALGDVGRGLEGFRATRERADRARRVAELAGWHPPTVTAHADVALVDLLSHDLAGARAFVHAELGELAARDSSAADLRATLRAVTAPHGGLAAAARELEVHRNTVLQRVRRAEELRGRPATERSAELFAALVLAEALPDAVLDAD
jgi:DNA-binding PucR family transcriptional regulator